MIGMSINPSSKRTLLSNAFNLLFNQRQMLIQNQLIHLQRRNFTAIKEGQFEFKSKSFLAKERDYSVDTLKHIKNPGKFEQIKPKEEYTKPKFDPNIRERPMEIPNHLLYRYMEGIIPQTDPQSAYVAVYHEGQTWHLFNAERISLGRLAVMAANFIRGKHKP